MKDEAGGAGGGLPGPAHVVSTSQLSPALYKALIYITRGKPPVIIYDRTTRQ